MCTVMKIADVVELEYNYMKRCASQEWSKHNKTALDEDLFHDTLLKCIEQMNNKNLMKEEIIAYIISSFKTNMLRETKYARHTKKDDSDVMNCVIPISDKCSIDIGMVKERILQNFENKDFDMFCDWLQGYTIKEINKKYQSTSARYIIDKIKLYIQKHYKLEDLE